MSATSKAHWTRPKTREELLTAAIALLRANDRGGTTVPAPALYPHQWNWDSAFAAIGWAHVDPRRAARELVMLLRGQWDDGMIPHITFHPGAESYEPGPRTWRTANAPGAPTGVCTSSITQPPLAATAARLVLEIAGGDAEVAHALGPVAEGLARWHTWFARDRDAAGDGIPCIVHPWESGLDNAPRWDAALARVDPAGVDYVRKDDTIVDGSERPTRFDYDRYFALVAERARLGFLPPRRDRDSFLVQDVALASILCRAERDLEALASALGKDVLAEQARARGLSLEKAIQARLYDPERGAYRDFDAIADERIDVEHVACLLPLFAGIAPPDAVARAVRLLDDPAFYGAPWPVPSVPLSDPRFDARRYWRGPSWININWMLVDGLRRAGEVGLATRLADRTIDLVAESGFREYFEPRTGEGLGAEDFAWTAALVIDLVRR
jgi:glycogen debranching enzyme